MSQELLKLRMLYFCLLLGFLQVVSFSTADGRKGLLTKRAEAMSVLLPPDANLSEKNHATQAIEKIMDRMENHKMYMKPKSAAYKRSNNFDDTDDYVDYSVPENELFVNVFDYDGLLNGTHWLVFSEADLEPTPMSKFESLKRFFSNHLQS